MATQLRQLTRSFSLISRSAVQPIRGEIANAPGNNMPFQTKNKPRLFITLVGLAAFGFSLPFVMVRFQMAKKET